MLICYTHANYEIERICGKCQRDCNPTMRKHREFTNTDFNYKLKFPTLSLVSLRGWFFWQQQMLICIPKHWFDISTRKTVAYLNLYQFKWNTGVSLHFYIWNKILRGISKATIRWTLRLTITHIFRYPILRRGLTSFEYLIWRHNRCGSKVYDSNQLLLGGIVIQVG